MRDHSGNGRFGARVPALVGFTLVLAACGGKPAPTPAAPGPAETTPEPAAVDAAPVEKPSRVGEGAALLDKGLSQGEIAAALTLADALAAEDGPEARVTAARIRLAAVAANGAGGPLAPDVEVAQLKLVLSAAEGPAQPANEDLAIAAKAALALRGVDPERLPPAGALHALMAKESPEAGALKALIGQSLREGLTSGIDQLGFGAVAARLGPLVCEGCGVMPEAGAELPEALRCAGEQRAVFCATIDKGREVLGALVDEPANRLALAALGVEAFARGAAADGAGHGGLALALPVVSTQVASGQLGTEGLGPERAPLTAVVISGEGVKIGVRAIVGADGARIGPDGLLLEQAEAVTLEAVLEAAVDKETGAVAGVSDRLRSVLDGLLAWDGHAGAGDAASVLVVIEASGAGGNPAAIGKVLDGIVSQKPRGIFVARGGQHRDALGAHVRTAPTFSNDLSPELSEAALGALGAGGVIVAVGSRALEVFAAEPGRDGPPRVIAPEVMARLPTSAEQGWRGERLVRLRIPLPPEAGEGGERMSAATLQALGDAVKALTELGEAGRVVHVVAGEGANAVDVVRVGRHLQEVGVNGWERLAEIPTLWPGARCRDGACAVSLAVFFSRAALPNTRGLTPKPEKGKKPPADKPEPGPAPSAAFCNEADIKVQMNRKTASFRFCYERELQLEKDLEGRVTMSFVIGLSGAVKNVRIANNALGSAKVADCLSREIAKIQFKAPDGGECVVQWPFSFRKN